MRRLLWIFMLVVLVALIPTQAQDALNLPSELYILSNDGVVQRFGLGSEGVTQVTPDSEFVVDFRVAPDANWLAYRTQAGLFMLNIFDESGNTIQIEDSRASLPLVRGQGETIAWAEDSSAIAYTTDYGGRVHFFADDVFVDLTTANLLSLSWSPDGGFLAAAAEDNVWWFYQRDGSTMILRAAIPGANGGDWLSDQQFLYAPVEGGLNILDFSAGNEQVQIVNNDAVYFKPSVTRDGQIVAFTGQFTAATLVQIELSPNFIGTEIPIGTGAVDLTSVQWTPGGFLLTAFQGGVIALINPITGTGFTLPVTSISAFSWGPTYPPLVSNVPLPSNGYFIAPDADGIRQVWILPSDGTRAQPITPAPLDISEFAISPDGQQVAYVSNSILWSFTIDSADEPTELEILGINDDIFPAWGPDNATIYYRDEQSEGNGIWRVTINGTPELFIADEENAIYTQPKPALGVAALLVHRGNELALADTTSGEVTFLNIIGEGDWQTGTTFIIVGESQREVAAANGLYLADANAVNTDPILVLPLLGSLQLLDYQVLDDGSIRMLVKNQDPGNVRILDVAADGSQPGLVGSAGNMVSPRISADGNFIIGQRTPNGVLLIYNILDDTSRQIDVEAPISDFVWQ